MRLEYGFCCIPSRARPVPFEFMLCRAFFQALSKSPLNPDDCRSDIDDLNEEEVRQHLFTHFRTCRVVRADPSSVDENAERLTNNRQIIISESTSPENARPSRGALVCRTGRPYCDRKAIMLPVDSKIEAVVLSVTLALSTNARTADGRASTAIRRGRDVSTEAQQRAYEACRIAVDLDSARSEMLAYIESRMAALAPNVTALVGAPVAARLVGIAGGLPALCRIVACNILVLGQTLRSAGGTAVGATHPKNPSLSSFQPPTIFLSFDDFICQKNAPAPLRVDAWTFGHTSGQMCQPVLG